MTMKIMGAEVFGLPELERRIVLLTNAGVGVEAIQKALLPGAELIADRWRANVPAPGPNHPYSTGAYRDGIEIGESQMDEGASFPGLDIFTEVVREEDGFNYPLALELGTSTMAAMPSAQPAFDDSVEEVVAMTVANLDKLIELAIAGAYAAGDIGLGQSLNVSLGVSRGGSYESGGAMR